MKRFCRTSGRAALWAIVAFLAMMCSGLLAEEGEIGRNQLFMEGITTSPSCESPGNGALILRGNSNDLSGLSISPFAARVTTGIWGEWSEYTKSNFNSTEGFSTDYFGGSLGLDRQLDDRVLVGFALIGSGLEISGGNPAYGGDVRTFAGKGHLSIFGNLWYIDFGVGAGRNWNEQTYLTETANWRNKYHANQWNYDLDFGLRIRKGYTRIDPFLGFHLTSLNEPDDANQFPTQTSSYNWSCSDSNSCRMFLGSRFSWEYQTYLALICPKMTLGWLHEFDDTNIMVTNEMLPFPVAWRFADNELSRDRLYLGAGITCSLKHSVDLFFYYNSILSGSCKDNLIYGGLYKKF